jgi:glycosyltransferase involved in cell wall biosynthesis
MKTLTIFTPTYNRAFCLHQLYDSLVAQTSQDFVWLVIDDGSTDTTQSLIASWTNENKIEIQYIHKENQGMHSAHNVAYTNIMSELNVCIDSDDFMPNTAVALILNSWKKADKTCAGLIGLDAFKDGSIVGQLIPKTLQTTSLNDLYFKYKVLGDKKVVIKTSVVREFPLYPLYENEKLVPLGVLYLMIDQKYKWFCVNEVFCIVEYLEDGSSRNILKQYTKSPKGFGYSRLIQMQYSKSIPYTFSRAMHYISSCLFQRKFDFFSGNPKKIITLFAIPAGVAFHVYLLFKLKK